MSTRAIEDILEYNLRCMRVNPPQREESELTRIDHIVFLLHNVINFKGYEIIMSSKLTKGEDLVMSTKETVIFLHKMVYPILVRLQDSTGTSDEDLRRRPSPYTTIVYLKHYLNNVDETKRMIRVIKEFLTEDHDQEHERL